MNDIDKNKVIELSSNDYQSEYKKEGICLQNLLPLALPLILVFSLSSGKGISGIKNTKENRYLPSAAAAGKGNTEIVNKVEHTVDKLSNVVDLMKKVNKLNDIKKSTVDKNTLDGIQDTFSVLKSIVNDTSKIEKLNSLENTLSTVKKISEVKKVFDVQRTMASKKTSDSSVSDMVGALTPLMPQGNEDNLKNIEKVVKMANLISSLNK